MSRPTATIAIGAGLSIAGSAEAAAKEAALEAAADVGGDDVDLAFLFLSGEHLEGAADAAEAVRATIEPRHVVGCIAGGVIARDRELEAGPAAAVWAASLPGASIEPFHATADPDQRTVAGVPSLEGTSLVTLLVDPFSFPVVPFLEELGGHLTSPPLVGGLAPGAGQPETQALVLDGAIHDHGAVGVALSGVHVRTLVSQGCAPVGPESVVTRAEGNVVFELAGKPALERLREVVGGLSPAEGRMAAEGLLAGLVVDENKAEYERGDYLMRGLLGADEESGAIAVGAPVRTGQTLRFHVRDAESADDDLRRTLAAGLEGTNSAGALLFTCNGRGRQLFTTPDHDASLAADALGSLALAGFFCGGELGPVGGRPFLHGFTATLAVFLDE